MKSLVLLVEEESMAALLEGVLPRIVPPDVPVDVIVHEGKSDLKKSIPRKLRAWGVPGARFMILIDQDANKCKELKAELLKLCKEAGIDDALVRIVCRSLEAWILGDLKGLSLAYQRPAIAKKGSIKKLRNPDKLGDPVGEVRGLVGEYQKVSGARRVGPHLSLEPGASSSPSFNVFVNGLQRLLAAD